MPRARKPAAAYTNRSDLIGAGPLPNATAPGQTYGVAAEQRAAQRALPMAPTPVPAPTPGPLAGGPSGPPAPQGPPQLADILSQAQAHNGPGETMALNRPTERPNEPVTAGLPTGPGPGPESLQGIGAAARESAVEQGTLAHLLQSMAAAPGATSAVRDLAARAQGGAM